MNKASYLVLCFLFGCIVESLLQLNVYIVIALMSLLMAFFWQLVDQKGKIEAARANKELQYQIQSTSKDAHLKSKQLITMLSSIPFPLLLVDQFGNIVMQNGPATKLRSDAIEIENPTYLKNAFLPKVQEFIKDSFILEKNFDRSFRIHDVDYQALSVPITTHGKFSGCLLLFQDITKALEGEKMQKRFIADASHELKTPISVMKGMVEILNRDDFDDAQTQKEFLSQMAIEVSRLDIIVKDMLVLSRLSVDQPLLDRSKVDMDAIIRGVQTSLQTSAEAKGLKLLVDSQYHQQVFCDPLRMSQVITNLVSNAIKYSEEGNITIRSYEQNTNFILEVEDQGCGLTSAQQEKIFDRFYRVNDDRARKSGGSGLGLAIVKSIVDAHGARIEIQSEVNKGTIFRMYLKN